MDDNRWQRDGDDDDGDRKANIYKISAAVLLVLQKFNSKIVY